jgi:hypothetical protein
MTWIEPGLTAMGRADGFAVPAGSPAAAPGVSAASPLVSLASRRAAIAACRAALVGLRGVMVACSDRDLAPLAGELAEVRALAGAGIVAVTAEAEDRGVVAASQCASTAAWVADAAWHSRREAATVAKTAALFRQPDCVSIADAVCAGDVDLASAVACGQEFSKLAPDLNAAAKPVVVEQMLDIAAEHGPTGVRRLTDEILARYGEEGSFDEQCARRRRHIDLSPGRHTASGLWDYRLTVDGEGRAVLEAAIGPGSAPKPANIANCGDPSAGANGSPNTSPGGGLTVTTRDSRPVGRRRGEALIDALRRSVAATKDGRPPVSPKTILMLTMNYEDLTRQVATRLDSYRHYGSSRTGPPGGSRPDGESAGGRIGRPGGRRPDGEAAGSRTGQPNGRRPDGEAAGGRIGPKTPGAATVLGSLAAGELISPDTARKIACDAGIIPVVLGRDGEILDQGRAARLFTPGQVRALWRRDRHCTFPDCDIPAAWCDAHHLTHWVDGGATGLLNAALLCSRHHTIVHRDQLAGHVIHNDCAATSAEHKKDTAAKPALVPRPAASVSWDLRPGSYHPPRAGDVDERLSA